MPNSSLRVRWTLAAFGILCLSACQQRETKAPATPTPTPVPTPSPIAVKELAPPRTQGEVLATLVSLRPKVRFRRRQELLWQDAEKGLEFRRFDAVQTHEDAEARIDFVNGSELQLKERTFAIINMDSSRPVRQREDRVVIRSGEVDGQTKKELWILTTAALIRMNARTASEPSKASIKVEDGKKMTVILQTGEATLVRPAQGGKGGTEHIELPPMKAVSFDAPRAPENFGLQLTDQDWKAPYTPPPSPTPTLTPTPEPKATLEVSVPSDGSETPKAEALVAGRCSSPKVSVLINGKKADLRGDLSFAMQVPLQMGVNSIVVQMIRPDGSSEFLRRRVIRKE